MRKTSGIPRRSFLRGLGTLVALPMLEKFMPSSRAMAALSPAEKAVVIPKRVAWVYVPNGMNMTDWTPAAEGSDFELPMILQPLQGHKSDLSIVTGLAHNNANSMGDGGGDHARSTAVYLTGARPKKTAADIKLGISVDQIAANKIGDRTRLPSLELCCDNGTRPGACDSGYSCAYQYNLSWRSENQPMYPEVDPRAAFERLFGSGDPDEDQQAKSRRELFNKSVLDFVVDDARRVSNGLGTNDRRKLDEYFTSIRALEKQIAKAAANAPKIPDGISEPEMFETFPQQIQLMYDVLALAFQTDSTRIATFMVAHDGSNRAYPFAGISEGHHDVSHHQNNPVKKAKIAQINLYHMKEFARFVDKLKSIKEGDGTLLDNCFIQYGSCISDGQQHIHENLPCLLVGGGGGVFKPGQHIRVQDRTPMANLFRATLDKFDVPTEKIGDSNGSLDSLFI